MNQFSLNLCVILVVVLFLALSAAFVPAMAATRTVTGTTMSSVGQGQIAGMLTRKNDVVTSYNLTLSAVPGVELYPVSNFNSTVVTNGNMMTFTLTSGDVLSLLVQGHNFIGTLTQSGQVTVLLIGTMTNN